MKNLIGRLLERRIPQYLLVYIGVAWGLMQFTQLILAVTCVALIGERTRCL